MSLCPNITITFAQSIDGCIATKTGDSRWISSDETLRLAHELRAQSDAVLVGAGTIRADNPRLTCRISGCASPIRIVLDGQLNTPAESIVVNTAHETPTWIICSDTAAQHRTEKREKLEQSGVRILSIPAEDSLSRERLSLAAVMDRIGGEGVQNLLVEGGGGVITACLTERLFDRIVLVIAPLIIGDGVSSVGDMNVRALSDALRLSPSTPRLLGPDLVWEVTRA